MQTDMDGLLPVVSELPRHDPNEVSAQDYVLMNMNGRKESALRALKVLPRFLLLRLLSNSWADDPARRPRVRLAHGQKDGAELRRDHGNLQLQRSAGWAGEGARSCDFERRAARGKEEEAGGRA